MAVLDDDTTRVAPSRETAFDGLGEMRSGFACTEYHQPPARLRLWQLERFDEMGGIRSGEPGIEYRARLVAKVLYHLLQFSVMELRQLNGSACKTYLIGCPKTKEAALVDPVIASTDEYLKFLEDAGWSLRYVIDTHTHADHISGGLVLRERTGAAYVMHKKAGSRHPNERLTDGSTLTLGELSLESIDTPGHTKDSVTLRLPGAVLTGDWLFIGAAGRTDLPGGDPGEHWDSLQRIIPQLDETTLVYPGHDYANHTHSSVGNEKTNNPNLKPRSRDDYVRWLASAAQATPEWMIETVRANNEGVTDPTVSFMPEGAESACVCAPSSNEAIAIITVDDVHASMDEPRLLLDVREPHEYTGPLGHVPGAILIPLGELPARLAELEAHKNQKVIAICRSGGRSAQATEILMKAGFTNVLNMTGGTLAWTEKGFVVER